MSREYTGEEKCQLRSLVRQIQRIDRNIFMIIAPTHIEEIIVSGSERRGEDTATWVVATLEIVAAMEAEGNLLPRRKRSPTWRRRREPPG